MAKSKIARTDLEAMRQTTMACWWPSRYFPKERPTWSGIRNELEGLAHDAETHRGDVAEAAEYTRLAAIAHAQLMAEYPPTVTCGCSYDSAETPCHHPIGQERSGITSRYA